MLCRLSGQLIVSNIKWPIADHPTCGELMNRIIYIVGLVVIVLFILGLFGLR